MISPALTGTASDLFIPTTIVTENGQTWTECVVPNRNYSVTPADMAILKKCGDPFAQGGVEEVRMGERKTRNEGSDDLQISIGSDHYEARFLGRGNEK